MDTSAPTVPTDPFGWVGNVIDGKYRVERVAGSGGFGIVYKAAHLAMGGGPVAIKCLKLGAEIVGADRRKLIAGLEREGSTLRRLSSATSHIVQAHDVGAAVSPSGTWSPYLVLEWLEGFTLAEEIGEHRDGRALSEAVALLGPAARALEIVHAEGVAHRDLKPENLFLARIGQRTILKLLDFGVAKVIEQASDLAASTAKTSFVMRAFTPSYGAPEQFASGPGATGPWTDVYALALILMEVVTGLRAYSGTSRDEIGAEALDPERRPSFSSLGVEVPDSVSRVMRKALAVDTGNRYPNAGEFWNALERALTEHRMSSGRSADTTEPVSTSRPPPGSGTQLSYGNDGRTTSPQLLQEAGGGRGPTKRRALPLRRSAMVLALAGTAVTGATAVIVARLWGDPVESATTDRVVAASSAERAVVPPTPRPQWASLLHATSCDSPCCGGSSCAVTDANSGKDCPAGAATCNSCLSGATCIAGECGTSFDGSELWELHLSAIGERFPGGVGAALGPGALSNLDPCKTRRDLWLCIRSPSHPEAACLSQVEACRHGATGAARSAEGIPITSSDLMVTGFDIEVREGGPSGRLLTTTIGAKYQGGVLRRVVCSGLRWSFPDTDPITYVAFLPDAPDH